jgi:hypothetical protein
MKRWAELTLPEQKAVRKQEFQEMLKALIEFGADLLPEYLATNFHEAAAKADRMQTPWFIHEYILEDQEIKEWLEENTMAFLGECYFLESGEVAVRIPFIKE